MLAALRCWTRLIAHSSRSSVLFFRFVAGPRELAKVRKEVRNKDSKYEETVNGSFAVPATLSAHSISPIKTAKISRSVIFLENCEGARNAMTVRYGFTAVAAPSAYLREH